MKLYPRFIVKAKEFALQLPQKPLKLIGADGKPTAFTHLFVAVDLLNTVAETDETSNTAVVEGAALALKARNRPKCIEVQRPLHVQ